MARLTNNRKITKILPGLSASYELVSMPEWAWSCLEDYMSFYDRPDVPSLLADFEGSLPPALPLGELLENIAAVHNHFMTQIRHELVNDNDPFDKTLPAVNRCLGPSHYPQNRTYPKAVKLFGFMPHATSFDSVMHRRKPYTPVL